MKSHVRRLGPQKVDHSLPNSSLPSLRADGGKSQLQDAASVSGQCGSANTSFRGSGIQFHNNQKKSQKSDGGKSQVAGFKGSNGPSLNNRPLGKPTADSRPSSLPLTLPDGGMSQIRSFGDGTGPHTSSHHLGKTPIDVRLFRKLVSGFHHEELVSEGLTHGFTFHFTGADCPLSSRNSKEANTHSLAVDEKLQEEINLGRIAGPYKFPPLPNFKASPLSLREKSTPGSYRLLHNLSYPYDDSSVNGGIDQRHKTVKYATVKSAIRVINSLGRGCFMAKADIKSAYRLVPVSPSHFHLLGFRWRGQYFYDKFLPMGMAESCAIFEKVSDAIVYIMKKFGVNNIVKVLDDFLILERSEIDCNCALAKFKYIMGRLNIPLVSDKTSNFAVQDITFLGIRLNSTTMTAHLPTDKLQQYSADIQAMQRQSTTTLRHLQQVIGKLQFSTCVIPIGKPFLRRLINLTIGRQQAAVIPISASVRADLEIWSLFLSHYNGTSFISDSPQCANEVLHLFSDASDLGFAGTYGRSWIQGQWDATWKSLNIAVRELYPILVLTKMFGHLWKNHSIVFHCDNQAIVAVINKQSAKDPYIMRLLRPLILQLMLNNITFHSVYIKSCDNTLADILSRFQETPQLLSTFGMKPSPSPVPLDLHPSKFIPPS